MTDLDGTVVLGRRQLFLLPTRYGLLFALIVAVLLLAAINYGNGLAYALGFLLAAVATVSMLHTHRNLHRLRISAGAAAPVFAGELARFDVALANEARAARFGVCLEQEKKELACVDLAGQGGATVALSVRAARRGYQVAPAFALATRFPLGLLYCWSRPIRLEQACLVYPKPAEPQPFRAAPTETHEAEQGARPGGDDFIGVREYRPGDSPRHIDWKAVARGGEWITKQFGGGYQQLLWLDWGALEGLDAETRLSVLCRWVLEAERAGLRYGLRLPGTGIAPDGGEAHRHACLRALALFPG